MCRLIEHRKPSTGRRSCFFLQIKDVPMRLILVVQLRFPALVVYRKFFFSMNIGKMWIGYLYLPTTVVPYVSLSLNYSPMEDIVNKSCHIFWRAISFQNFDKFYGNPMCKSLFVRESSIFTASHFFR